jgi:hypothetical protein
MSAKKTTTIPAAKLALYDVLLASKPSIERKGATTCPDEEPLGHTTGKPRPRLDDLQADSVLKDTPLVETDTFHRDVTPLPEAMR